MIELIRISKTEFINFCHKTAPATRNNSFLSHESRVFLFLYRVSQDASIHILGALFRVSPNTAMKAFNDILFFLFMKDSYIPSVWNDPNISDAEIEDFLANLRDSQSPVIRYN